VGRRGEEKKGGKVKKKSTSKNGHANRPTSIRQRQGGERKIGHEVLNNFTGEKEKKKRGLGSKKNSKGRKGTVPVGKSSLCGLKIRTIGTKDNL